MRKGLFWFPVSEISVLGHLALLFLDHDETECHGTWVWQGKPVPLLAAREKAGGRYGRREEGEKMYILGMVSLFRASPPVIHIPELTLPLNNSIT